MQCKGVKGDRDTSSKSDVPVQEQQKSEKNSEINVTEKGRKIKKQKKILNHEHAEYILESIDQSVNQETDPHTEQKHRDDTVMCACEGGGVVSKDISPSHKHQIRLFFDKEGKKPTAFFIRGDISKSSWDLIRNLSVKYSDLYKVPVFMGVINWSQRLKSITKISENIEVLNLISSTKDGYYFLNQPPRKEQKINLYTPVNTYKFACLIGQNVEICYSRKVLKEGKDYFCEGIEFPNFGLSKNRKTSTSILEKTYLIVHAHEIEDKFSELNDVLPHIKKIQDFSLVWNYQKDEPIYSEEEVALITMNAFYYGEGVNAFNLILCGAGDSNKSTYLKMLNHVFEEKTINTNNSTAKGMVPSFYSDTGSLGAILEAKFIACLDDLFRLFDKSNQMGIVSVKNGIKNGLQDFMNIFDRTKEEVISGKAKFNVHMKSSFFATDNFKYADTLRQIYKEDEALCRRISFLHLSADSVTRATSILPPLEMSDVFSKARQRLAKIMHVENPWKYIRLMYRYMRTFCNQVRFDAMRVSNITTSIIRIPEHLRHFKSKSRALICSVVLMNEMIQKDSLTDIKLEADESDYILYERLLRRLYKDYCMTFTGSEPIEIKPEESVQDEKPIQ